MGAEERKNHTETYTHTHAQTKSHAQRLFKRETIKKMCISLNYCAIQSLNEQHISYEIKQNLHSIYK